MFTALNIHAQNENEPKKIKFTTPEATETYESMTPKQQKLFSDALKSERQEFEHEKQMLAQGAQMMAKQLLSDMKTSMQLFQICANAENNSKVIYDGINGSEGCNRLREKIIKLIELSTMTEEEFMNSMDLKK